MPKCGSTGSLKNWCSRGAVCGEAAFAHEEAFPSALVFICTPCSSLGAFFLRIPTRSYLSDSIFD